MGRIIAQQQQLLTHLHKRLQHPGNRLQQQTQHLDHLDIRLRRAMATKLERLQTLVRGESQKLGVQNPQLAITSYQQQLADMHRQMTRSLNQQLQQNKNRVAQTMHLLDAVSPLKTVGRGYAIIRDQQGAVIKTVAAVHSGDQLKGQLADGEIRFTVNETNNKGL
jgi:exodeoxyribonuclease VII large subunit